MGAASVPRASDRTDANRRALAELLAGAEAATVFTGAGISTECGVPDYRSPGSLWRIHVPIGFADYLADPACRAEAWRRKFAMDDVYAGARPGRGHQTIARWAAAGRVAGVVTQNVDGLHRDSGLDEACLVELHGNGTFARCLDCGLRHELAPIRARFEQDGTLPVCACGGIVKSASVAFGQPLVPDDIRRAAKASLACDLFIILGSTLKVRPAARFPELALKNGARLAIVNREPTPLDDVATLVIHDDIGDVLDGL